MGFAIQQGDMLLEGPAWQFFIGAIKSKATKHTYQDCLKLWGRFYQQFRPVQVPEDLLIDDNKVLEARIIQFIEYEKADGKSYANINNKKSAISLFYNVNDRDLRWKKISRYMPESRRLTEDRAYTKQELQALLDIVPLKLKAIILFLSSSGARIGALPELRLKHLERLDNLYRVTFYPGTRDQYFSYISPEATKTLDLYLKDRQKTGEQISQESWVFRNNYQSFYNRPMRPATPITRCGISVQLTEYALKSGVRRKKSIGQCPRKNRAEGRAPVQLIHGMRKFFTGAALASGVSSLVVDMLLGHNTGLMQSYYKPTQEEMLEMYKKIIPAVSINDSTTLKIENEELKGEQASTIANLQQQLANLQRQVNKFIPDNADSLKLVDSETNEVEAMLEWKPIPGEMTRRKTAPQG